MRIAFIILAHQNPQQLLRLVKSLQHPSVDCWIHLDKRSIAADFKEVFGQENVFAVELRVKVSWGCFSVVEAMINSLQAAISYHDRYDYFHFLSGQDYPLQPVSFFLKYLQVNTGYDFVGNRPLEESTQNIARFKNYHFNEIKQPFKSVIERSVNYLFPKRRFPFSFAIRKGPQWMTLTKKAVEYILDFTKKNPAYSNYFKRTHAPDEFFFQTILYNSPFIHQLKNQIFHYIDWSEQKKNPKTLTIADKEKLLASDHFFARKFNSRIDNIILDEIDKKLNGL